MPITPETEPDDTRAIDDAVAVHRQIQERLGVSQRDVGVGEALAEICRDWIEFMGFTPPSQLATCIGCGCDDNHSCSPICEWLAVDRAAHRGVCSSCEHRVSDFEAMRSDDLQETVQHA